MVETQTVLKTLFNTEEEFLEFLRTRLFTLHFKPKYKPDSGIILAKDLQDAKKRGWAYCQRFNIRFLSITPFFIDLNASPKYEEHSD